MDIRFIRFDPIYLGIKVAIYDDCEGEKEQKELNEKVCPN